MLVLGPVSAAKLTFYGMKSDAKPMKEMLIGFTINAEF